MPPPELTATVRKKRNTSRKLDLPEAFGPIRYVVSASAASTLRKFSQFLRRMWSIRMVLIVLNRLRRPLDQSQGVRIIELPATGPGQRFTAGVRET